MLVGEVTITNRLGHTFTFPQGTVINVSDVFELSPSQMKMPVSGPLANIVNDFDGVGQAITINGELTDLDQLTGVSGISSVVTGGTNPPTITTAEQMMYWLKSLANGAQMPFEFTAPSCKKALLTSSGQTEIAGVMIPGTWDTPKGVITTMSFDTQTGNIDMIPYSLTIWIAGF